MEETIMVEAECLQSTAADIDYFEQGRTYTIDMWWAKKRGVWKYFRPLREVPDNEAKDRIHDEILPGREAATEARAEANEEAEAKLKEKKLNSVKSYPGPKARAKAKSRK